MSELHPAMESARQKILAANRQLREANRQLREANRRLSELGYRQDETSKKAVNIAGNHQAWEWRGDGDGI